MTLKSYIAVYTEKEHEDQPAEEDLRRVCVIAPTLVQAAKAFEDAKLGFLLRVWDTCRDVVLCETVTRNPPKPPKRKPKR